MDGRTVDVGASRVKNNIADLRFRPPCDGTDTGESRGRLWGRAERKGWLPDRRYLYGDPRSPPQFCPAWYFIGSIRFTYRSNCPDQPLMIGLPFQVGRCGLGGSAATG